jgi:hypothetical protein
MTFCGGFENHQPIKEALGSQDEPIAIELGMVAAGFGYAGAVEQLQAEQELARFIAKFSPEIAALAQSILAAMRERYPTAVQLVYDNYNALAIGFGPTERASEAIFSIAVFPRWVSLFFLQGAGLPDPDGILKGSGNVVRHIRLASADTLSELPVKKMMREAAKNAAIPFAARGTPRLMIKSISAKQRPRRPRG